MGRKALFVRHAFRADSDLVTPAGGTRLANLSLCLVAWRLASGAHQSQAANAWARCSAYAAKYVRPIRRDGATTSPTPRRFPTMKFVATKTAEQLDLQALNRVR